MRGKVKGRWKEDRGQGQERWGAPETLRQARGKGEGRWPIILSIVENQLPICYRFFVQYAGRSVLKSMFELIVGEIFTHSKNVTIKAVLHKVNKKTVNIFNSLFRWFKPVCPSGYLFNFFIQVIFL